MARIKKTDQPVTTAQKLGSLIVEAKLPTVGVPPAATYEGDGYIMVRHPDTSVVTEAVQEIVASVRVELG